MSDDLGDLVDDLTSIGLVPTLIGFGNDAGTVPDDDDLKADAAHLDTPIHRATINKLTVVELETMLDKLRERRLVVRQKIERAAKVKTEKSDLTAYLKFEKMLKACNKSIEKLDAAHTKLEADVHKLRALTLEMGDLV